MLIARLLRACIACRHYAIDLNTYKPFTRQEARGVDASESFKGVRVYSTHKGEATGGKPVSREETTLLSIRAPHLRPLIAISQRFRSCTGTSVLLKSPGAYTQVLVPSLCRACGSTHDARRGLRGALGGVQKRAACR